MSSPGQTTLLLAERGILGRSGARKAALRRQRETGENWVKDNDVIFNTSPKDAPGGERGTPSQTWPSDRSSIATALRAKISGEPGHSPGGGINVISLKRSRDFMPPPSSAAHEIAVAPPPTPPRMPDASKQWIHHLSTSGQRVTASVGRTPPPPSPVSPPPPPPRNQSATPAASRFASTHRRGLNDALNAAEEPAESTVDGGRGRGPGRSSWDRHIPARDMTAVLAPATQAKPRFLAPSPRHTSLPSPTASQPMEPNAAVPPPLPSSPTPTAVPLPCPRGTKRSPPSPAASSSAKAAEWAAPIEHKARERTEPSSPQLPPRSPCASNRALPISPLLARSESSPFEKVSSSVFVFTGGDSLSSDPSSVSEGLKNSFGTRPKEAAAPVRKQLAGEEQQQQQGPVPGFVIAAIEVFLPSRQKVHSGVGRLGTTSSSEVCSHIFNRDPSLDGEGVKRDALEQPIGQQEPSSREQQHVSPLKAATQPPNPSPEPSPPPTSLIHPSLPHTSTTLLHTALTAHTQPAARAAVADENTSLPFHPSSTQNASPMHYAATTAKLVDSEASAKLVDPEASAKLVDSEASAKLVDPAASAKLVDPEASAKLVDPEASAKLVDPEAPPERSADRDAGSGSRDTVSSPRKGEGASFPWQVLADVKEAAFGDHARTVPKGGMLSRFSSCRSLQGAASEQRQWSSPLAPQPFQSAPASPRRGFAGDLSSSEDAEGKFGRSGSSDRARLGPRVESPLGRSGEFSDAGSQGSRRTGSACAEGMVPARAALKMKLEMEKRFKVLGMELVQCEQHVMEVERELTNSDRINHLLRREVGRLRQFAAHLMRQHTGAAEADAKADYLSWCANEFEGEDHGQEEVWGAESNSGDSVDFTENQSNTSGGRSSKEAAEEERRDEASGERGRLKASPSFLT